MEDLIAFCAGLFEGEGCIHNLDKDHTWRLTINMTDIEPLELFQSVIGGRILGPYNKGIGRKPMHMWTIYGYLNVQRIYEQFKKYLCPRRVKQFEKVLSVKPKRWA